MLRSVWFLPASLIVFTFLCFFNAIHHPFVHDDIAFIVQNPRIGQLNHLGDIFFKPSHPAYDAGINAYYRPILELFNRLQYQLFGFNAVGYHLINVIIHILNGLLLFAFLSRLQFSKLIAYVVSLFFLIHPVQSEAVACVSGISNLLAAFFVLLSLYSYIRENYPGMFVAFLLALLTKEQAIVLPGLLILIDWYRQKRNRQGVWIVLVVVTLGFLWFRSLMTGAHVIEDILQSPGELKLRLLAIPNTIVMYLRLIVFPVDLHYYRNTDILQPAMGGFFVLGGLLLVLFALIKKFAIHTRGIIFGCAWFIITLSVVLNIIPLINEYSLILTAEHFLYLPMVGVVIVLCLLFKQFVSKRLWVVLTAIILMGAGIQTVYQNTFWRGEIPLFERTISFERHFARGYILLARAYFVDQQFSLAQAHYHKALNIMQGYAKKATHPTAQNFYKGFIKEINEGLAHCALAQKNLDQAIFHFTEALAINPKDAGLLNNLAVCYIQKGDPYQAEQFLKITLGINPHYAPARDNLRKLMKDN